MSTATILTSTAVKVCAACQNPKPVSAFGIEKRNRSGVASTCRACDQARTYDWRNKNRLDYNASAREAYRRRVNARRFPEIVHENRAPKGITELAVEL